MDKKTFWRGFGEGVLFASMILGISCLIRTSDSQVVSRAKKLGMVYEKEADTTNVSQKAEGTAAPSAEETQKATAAPKQTEVPEGTAAPTAEKDDTEQKATATPKSNAEQDAETELQQEKKKIEQEKEEMEQEVQKASKNLEIKAGDWSSTVSERLESMGIIDDAKDFDVYLNDHGYSSSINAGTYQVSPDDTYQELARKITGK